MNDCFPVPAIFPLFQCFCYFRTLSSHKSMRKKHNHFWRRRSSSKSAPERTHSTLRRMRRSAPEGAHSHIWTRERSRRNEARIPGSGMQERDPFKNPSLNVSIFAGGARAFHGSDDELISELKRAGGR